MHASKITVQRGDRLTFLGRLNDLGHAFTEDQLRKDKHGDQPVQTDLIDCVALDGTDTVSCRGHGAFLCIRLQGCMRRDGWD